jgi:superfamily II DNA or RNA helicase
MEYSSFLAKKELRLLPSGRAETVNSGHLYPFQRSLVERALGAGRYAIFADCGLGKTRVQLEWAARAGGKCLIVAPLAVVQQTIAEAAAIGLEVVRVSTPSDERLQITNYQRLDRFVGADYDAIVLDESSILKSVDGKTRTKLLTEFSGIPWRLCCTATPAPNDITELANHSQFLGAMTRAEMLAAWFVHEEGADWRLKRHSVKDFWRWVGSWATFACKPSDVGDFSDDAFNLPPIRESIVKVDGEWSPGASGSLFPDAAGIHGRRKVRRDTLDEVVARCAEIALESKDKVVIWTGLNAESDALANLLGADACNIEGATDDESRLELEAAWRSRKGPRALITKPSMFSFGVNWQHCHRMIFCNLSDSYEQYYQCIRRAWRFGQRKPVDVQIVTSALSVAAVENVQRKARAAAESSRSVIEMAGGFSKKRERPRVQDDASGDG